MAICGLSAEYELADVVAHLAVPPEEWFEMSAVQRADYVKKFNHMALEEAIREKSITVSKTASAKPVEERGISIDLKTSLQSISACPAGVIATIVKEAHNLLNCNNAIQQMPSALAVDDKRKKYLVAAKTCKKEIYECLVFRDHLLVLVNVTSITVFVNTAILKEHLDYLSKLPRSPLPSKSNLVEPAKDAQGKKGGAHKNPWRPSRGGAAPKHPFTEIHHNNQPFVVGFLDDQPHAKECGHCRVGFLRRQQIVPFDIILAHQEKWMYPSPTDPKTKLPSSKCTTKYTV